MNGLKTGTSSITPERLAKAADFLQQLRAAQAAGLSDVAEPIRAWLRGDLDAAAGFLRAFTGTVQ